MATSLQHTISVIALTLTITAMIHSTVSSYAIHHRLTPPSPLPHITNPLHSLVIISALFLEIICLIIITILDIICLIIITILETILPIIIGFIIGFILVPFIGFIIGIIITKTMSCIIPSAPHHLIKAAAVAAAAIAYKPSNPLTHPCTANHHSISIAPDQYNTPYLSPYLSGCTVFGSNIECRHIEPMDRHNLPGHLKNDNGRNMLYRLYKEYEYYSLQHRKPQHHRTGLATNWMSARKYNFHTLFSCFSLHSIACCHLFNLITPRNTSKKK
eukprot:393105_1